MLARGIAPESEPSSSSIGVIDAHSGSLAYFASPSAMLEVICEWMDGEGQVVLVEIT